MPNLNQSDRPGFPSGLHKFKEMEGKKAGGAILEMHSASSSTKVYLGGM